MNAKVVLEWVKANVVTVVFVVIVIGALIGLPLLAGSMNQAVEQAIQTRESAYQELNQLEKTSVSVPAADGGLPQSQSILINQSFIEQYRRMTEIQGQDAAEVLAAAEAHNRQDHDVFNDNVLPGPMTVAEREVLPQRFYETVRQAYRDLLEEVGAEMPPSPAELAQRLEQARSRFLGQMLAKDVDDQLTQEEQQQLRDELAKVRLGEYSRVADRIRFYASFETLNPPFWDQSYELSMTELYDWQWRYWITEDILQALADANREAGSVATAPVKRLVSITIEDQVAPAAAGGSGGRGGRGGGAPPAPTPPNPKTEVKRDFAVSLTGRLTNPLYDVRRVTLELIVSAERYPFVIDALARQNFMTVLDMDLEPADPYEEIRQGFFYGSEPVYRMTLQLETIWLRSWTSQFMPQEVRQMLGVPEPQPEAPPAG